MAHFKLHIYIIALVAIGCCVGQNDTSTANPQTGDGSSTDEESSLKKGMKPIIKMTQNFLETVMPFNFYDSDTPFNVEKLTEIVKNKSYSDLNDDWQDLVDTFGGFAACIIMGLLFVVAMPIIGIMYCCCYCCCHHCGGSRDLDDSKRAPCQRTVFAGFLLAFTTLMLAGSIVTLLSGELLHRSLQNSDHDGMVGRLEDSLTTMQTFTRNTVSELQTKTDVTVSTGLNNILSEVVDAANNTVDRVKLTINATHLLNQADDLGDAAKEALNDLEMVNSSLHVLTALQTNVSDELDRIKRDVNTTCAGSAQCPDMSSLNFVPKFDTLKKLQDEASKVTTAQDIETRVQEAKDEFVKVSSDIEAKVQTNIQESRQKVTEIKDTLMKEIKELNKSAEPFVNALQDGRDFMKDENETIKDIGNYIWYTCIGLACAVLLVVVFYYLGVLLGVCGERPDYTASCCNRGSGANLLMTGICASFLFAWLLMLVVILLFTLGGLSYTMACRYLDDGVENVGNFESVLSDGFGWNVSKSFNVTNLTVADMFTNCKENQGFYTALNFKSIYNIDNIFDVADIKNQVQEMTKKQFNISNIHIMTGELNNSLQAYATSGLKNIDFQSYKDEISKSVISSPLQTAIDALKSAAAAPGIAVAMSVYMTFTDPRKVMFISAFGVGEHHFSQATSLRGSASDLQSIEDNQLVQVEEEKVKLLAAVESLERNMNLTMQVNNLVNSITTSEHTFNSQKDGIIKNELNTSVVEINRLIEDTANSTIHTVKNEIGKCRPIYDAAQSVIDAACVGMLDPLNSIWFGLGWCLFCYIPSFVFAALLVGLYRKTNPYTKKRDFDDPIRSPYSGGYDGYRGNQEDNIPLTSQQRQDQANGKYNAGYDNGLEGRDVHRDPPQREASPPDSSMYSGGRDGATGYAEPSVHRDDHYDKPPRYDEVAMSDFYRGVGNNQGGYAQPNNRY